tara:strand:- start:207 stop:392 length:186 start_codon:yes stop_codon:yes gene_type:complete
MINLEYQNLFGGYERDKVIAKLMEKEMDLIEATEYFELYQIGAWMGDTTPCFLNPSLSCPG